VSGADRGEPARLPVGRADRCDRMAGRMLFWPKLRPGSTLRQPHDMGPDPRVVTPGLGRYTTCFRARGPCGICRRGPAAMRMLERTDRDRRGGKPAGRRPRRPGPRLQRVLAAGSRRGGRPTRHGVATAGPRRCVVEPEPTEPVVAIAPPGPGARPGAVFPRCRTSSAARRAPAARSGPARRRRGGGRSSNGAVYVSKWARWATAHAAHTTPRSFTRPSSGGQRVGRHTSGRGLGHHGERPRAGRGEPVGADVGRAALDLAPVPVERQGDPQPMPSRWEIMERWTGPSPAGPALTRPTGRRLRSTAHGWNVRSAIRTGR